MADIFEIVGRVSIEGLSKAENDLNNFSNAGEKTSSKLSKFGSVLGGIGKTLAVVGTTAVTGAVALGKSVVGAYGQYEQLVGGVETLFKDSSSKLIEYADNAYKTAGLSANDYMSTVTSFSASLIQSLNGDTEKAVTYADMAITDMSDNANKMGTSMEMIQNAYQGFAKQNYTMLDNLKLGYGGTKTEMERLLADAQKISGVKYEIGNFSDMVEAIHVIQNEMGITGTTALEAEHTIQGSINSLKGAFSNLLVGFGDANADMDLLCQNVVNSFTNVFNNISPIIKNIANALPNALKSVIPTLGELIPTLLETITDLATEIINGLVQMLPQIIPLIVDMLLKVAETLIQNAPLIIDAVILLVTEVLNSLSEMLPTLIPIIVDAVLMIVDTLINNIDLLIEAGGKLIVGLTNGLIRAIPQLVAKIPQITGSLANALLKGIPQLITVGGQMLQGLFKGFLDPEAIWKAVKKLFNGIVGGIKSLFEIRSPSKVTAELGKYMAQGLGVGIDEDDSAEKAIQHKVETISNVDNMIGDNPLQRYQVDFNTQFNSLNDGFNNLMNLLGQYLPVIIENMNRDIVLDSGLLVGSTIKDIDKQLGIRSNARVRGNV